jgi:hypothetical protein
MEITQNVAGRHQAGYLVAAAPGRESAEMNELLRAFRREANGTWVCVEPATFDGPNGRVQVTPGTAFTPGSMFMGADLAKWLDEQLALFGKRPTH